MTPLQKKNPKSTANTPYRSFLEASSFRENVPMTFSSLETRKTQETRVKTSHFQEIKVEEQAKCPFCGEINGTNQREKKDQIENSPSAFSKPTSKEAGSSSRRRAVYHEENDGETPSKRLDEKSFENFTKMHKELLSNLILFEPLSSIFDGNHYKCRTEVPETTLKFPLDQSTRAVCESFFEFLSNEAILKIRNGTSNDNFFFRSLIEEYSKLIGYPNSPVSL